MVKICEAAVLNVRKWSSCYRIYMIVPLIIVFTNIHAKWIYRYIEDQQLAISNWYCVFQMGDGITRMLFYFALILLVCNAPYSDEQQLFSLIRLGRRKWMCGQILYTFLANVIFFIMVAIIGTLMFFPHVGFSSNWEAIIVTLSKSEYGKTAGITQEVLQAYSPVKAFLLTYSLNILIGFMISLIVLIVNMLNYHVKGSVVAVGVVVISQLAGNYSEVLPWLNFISPISWSSLDIFAAKYTNISIIYAYAFLIIMIACLLKIIMIKDRNYVMQVKGDF